MPLVSMFENRKRSLLSEFIKKGRYDPQRVSMCDKLYIYILLLLSTSYFLFHGSGQTLPLEESV